MSDSPLNLPTPGTNRFAAIIPVAPRPDRVKAFLKHLYQIDNISRLDVYLGVDRCNQAFNDIAEEFPAVSVIRSNHNSHLHTLNSCARQLSTEYDYLFYFNDDMFPEQATIPKSLMRITELEVKFPDKAFAFYFKDGHQNENLSTTFCVSKNYIKLLGGKLSNDEYFHGYFADQEFFLVGKKLKRLFYCEEISVRHDHFELKDEINFRNESSMWKLDNKIFWIRRLKGFGISQLRYRLKNIEAIPY